MTAKSASYEGYGNGPARLLSRSFGSQVSVLVFFSSQRICRSGSDETRLLLDKVQVTNSIGSPLGGLEGIVDRVKVANSTAVAGQLTVT